MALSHNLLVIYAFCHIVSFLIFRELYNQSSKLRAFKNTAASLMLYISFCPSSYTKTYAFLYTLQVVHALTSLINLAMDVSDAKADS